MNYDDWLQNEPWSKPGKSEDDGHGAEPCDIEKGW